jgi:Spy/CpxP family protein refolding chaperone
MKKGLLILLACTCLGVTTVVAKEPKDDVFKGKLFAPNVILENQAELELSKQQFTEIKRAVVDVQANVAEHEWDVREAYQSILAELDSTPIDEAQVLEYVDAALRAENEVKKLQVAMLIKLKNLLTPEQVAYLESIRE